MPPSLWMAQCQISWMPREGWIFPFAIGACHYIENYHSLGWGRELTYNISSDLSFQVCNKMVQPRKLRITFCFLWVLKLLLDSKAIILVRYCTTARHLYWRGSKISCIHTLLKYLDMAKQSRLCIPQSLVVRMFEAVRVTSYLNSLWKYI